MLRILFSLVVALVFLAIGTVVGGIYFVPAGSGLAAAPIALSYGLITALIVGLLAFILYPRITPAQRKWLWLPAVTSLFIIAAILVRSYIITQSDQQAYLDEMRRNFPPFELTWQSAEEFDRGFTRLQLNSMDGSVRIGYADGRNCTATIGETSTEKSDLLAALRNIEGEVYRNPQLCSANGGVGDNSFVYTIHEILPPANSADLELSQSCLDSNPLLATALDSIERVYRRLRRSQQCQ